MSRLTDIRLNSREVATITAAIAEHLVARSVDQVVPFGAHDLSISVDGDVLIEPRPRFPPEPVLAVINRLLRELVQLVDDPAPALIGIAENASRAGTSSDVGALAAQLEQIFDLRDSRDVLRPVAEQMNSASGATDAYRPEIVSVPDAVDLSYFPLEIPESAGSRAKPTRARVVRRTAPALAILTVALLTGSLLYRTDFRNVGANPGRPPRTHAIATDRREPPPMVSAPRAVTRDKQTQKQERTTVSPPMHASAPNVGTADVHSAPLETPGIAGPVFSPSFDASGSAMFFHVGRSPRTQLVEGTLDQREQLVELKAFADDGSRNYHVRLSPDGTQVAFDSDRDGQRGVYVARRDGSMIRKVSGSGFAAVPTWSPDGARLAFVRGEPSNPAVWNLWLLDVATGALERVTAYRFGQLWGASWFPDGARVCYSHEGSLYLEDLASHSQERFESPLRGHMVRTPAVSPEGRRIVFQVHRDGVWMLNLDDRTMRRILYDPTAEEFTWDSRGARIAYHSSRDGQWRIWITAPLSSSVPST